MTPHLTIVRGTPGSGKSTYAKSLGLVHFEADQFLMDHEGNYNWKPETVSNAHGWCYNSVVQNLTMGLSVVVSNTFTRIREMAKYIDFCKENGIPFKVVKCVGDFGNTHDVPPNTLENMKCRWEDYEGEIVNEI
jgi:predicted kinase